MIFHMFNSLTGKITAKLPQTLYLQTGSTVTGVLEWDISVPDSSLDIFPSSGENARVFVWMYHREDAVKLYGFATAGERTLFLDLMKVEGVGPKAALKILSHISAQQLTVALESEDLARLEAISGIGKKTAQKMLLALKGKLTLYETSSASAKVPSKWQDVIAALVQMGYDKKAVEEVLILLEGELDTTMPRAEQEEHLFRKAIMELAT